MVISSIYVTLLPLATQSISSFNQWQHIQQSNSTLFLSHSTPEKLYDIQWMNYSCLIYRIQAVLYHAVLSKLGFSYAWGYVTWIIWIHEQTRNTHTHTHTHTHTRTHTHTDRDITCSTMIKRGVEEWVPWCVLYGYKSRADCWGFHSLLLCLVLGVTVRAWVSFMITHSHKLTDAVGQ